MVNTVHVIGNGKTASYFDNENAKGVRLTCNLPPFSIDNVYATGVVDFKMCRAITAGEISIPGMWVCGMRPKIYAGENPGWHMKYAAQIREFYTTLPDYVNGYTAFNCGHMVTHYGLTKFAPKELHMYGFDSMFDMDMTSCTDFYLPSDRSNDNNARLARNWRGIWPKIFEEFPNTGFTIHGKHDKIKFQLPDNVRTVIK
jgi:hypothetical protein